MKSMMCILGAIPNRLKGQEFFYSLSFVFSLLILPGCVTSQSTASLAPQPPSAQHDFIESDVPLYAAHYFAPQESSYAVLADEGTVPQQSEAFDVAVSVKDNSEPEKRCRIKDRFDREALIAYEWDRSRFALDVDGIGGGSDGSGARIEYKIRLQPEKTDKQKCRYSSKWQGLLGSGYNELVLRKEDTVMQEIRVKRNESLEFISSLF